MTRVIVVEPEDHDIVGYRVDCKVRLVAGLPESRFDIGMVFILVPGPEPIALTQVQGDNT